MMACLETNLPKMPRSRRWRLPLGLLRKAHSLGKYELSLRFICAFGVLVSGGCAALEHREEHVPNRQEALLRGGAATDASPDGAQSGFPPKNPGILATAEDRQGTRWILREDAGRSYTMYTLLKQVGHHLPQVVAGPDSSFYFFLEENIPDRSVAMSLTKQELQRAIAESGRDAIQESILQKGMLMRIQRDTYRAMGFQLPAKYSILSTE